MASPTAKSAVSDYEHLKYVSSKPWTNVYTQYNESSDDSLPLMQPAVPPPMLNFNTNNSNVGHRAAEMPEFTNTLGSLMRQDLDGLGARTKVPVPSTWNPETFGKMEPSIFITPEKTKESVLKDSDRNVIDNLLQPKDLKSVPLPVNWSPGMVLKPNPNLFVTPEKPVVSKKSASLLTEDKRSNYRGTVSDFGSINGLKDDVNNLRAKQKVRFDLPSMSSGDETSDAILSEAENPDSPESPIVIKGAELNKSPNQDLSPTWKTYSPLAKVYNPNLYSDTSTLEDDSFLEPSQQLKESKSKEPSQFFPSKTPITDNLISELKKMSASAKTHIASLADKQSSQSKGAQISNSETKTKSSLDTRNAPSSKKSSTKTVKESTMAKKASSTKPASHTKVEKVCPQPAVKGLPSMYEPSGPTHLVVRESKHHTDSTNFSYPFKAPPLSGNAETEHVFARPEFNSTLKVREEIDDLMAKDVNVNKVVEKTLAKSEVTRTELNEKAAVHTNLVSDQFTNLIDLEAPVESVCDRVIRMRTTTVKQKKKAVPPASKKSTSAHKTPDLMEFFPHDLQKEQPDLSLPGVTLVTSELGTAPADLAFDLYRHNRAWQGINDFS